MKNRFLASVFIFAFGILLAACSENNTENIDPHAPTINLRLDQTRSRAAFGKGYAIDWQAGDQVNINGTVCDVWKSTTDDSWWITAPAATDGIYRAVYPASAYNNGTCTLPATQTYTAGSFDPAAFVAEATLSVSESDAGSSGILKFKYLGAVVKFTITGTQTLTSLVLAANAADEPLAGSGTLNFTTNESLTISSNASDRIAMTCGDGVQLTTEGVDFYFVVPATTLSQGFTLAALSSDNTVMDKSRTSSITIDRADIKSMPAFAFEGSMRLQYSFNGGAWQNVPAERKDYPAPGADVKLAFRDVSSLEPGLSKSLLYEIARQYVLATGSYSNRVSLDFSQATYESDVFDRTLTEDNTEPALQPIGLKELTLPKNIKSTIDSDSHPGVFSLCAHMEKIVFPASMEKIGNYTCYFCQDLTSVTILGEAGILEIGDNAFSADNSLTTIYCYRTIPPQITATSISNPFAQTTTYVPQASLEDYKTQWAEADTTFEALQE